MNRLACAVFVLSTTVPALAQEVAEPKSGTKFAAKDGDLSLLGVGLRKKSIVKVYAVGLYVADSALSGPLKGKAGTPDLYQELLKGDFKKKIVMKFVRDVSTDQIRGGFRDSLKGTGEKSEVWIGYFTDIKSGQECVIAWTPGVGLETKVGGLNNPPLNDKVLASAVFGIWLGDKPIQEDIKKDLVERSAELLR